MIRFYRVWAVVWRHLLIYTRGLDKINTLFYWPFINIVIFGLTAATASNENSAVVAQILACIGAWQVMLRITFESSNLVFLEISSQNIVNLLATPLTFLEWVLVGAVMGLITMGIVTMTCVLSIYGLFGVALWKLGIIWLPILLLLTLSGLIFTYLISGFFMIIGLRAIDVMYSVIWVFVPFSSAYAPLETMPLFIQKMAIFLPFAYIFGPLRTYMATGCIDVQSLIIAFMLNVIYLFAAIGFFKYCFNKSKRLGIARLS